MPARRKKMLIYQGNKTDFMDALDQDILSSQLEELVYEKMNRRTSKQEFRSWENSLQYMYKVLNDDQIPNDSGIAIEYNIPQTSMRIDFIITGYDSNNKGSAVVIELKQWEKVNLVDSADALVETYVGNAIRNVVHPSYQAWSYCTMIKDYNQSVHEKEIKLFPCAYLHNYKKQENDVIENKIYKQYIEAAPVFAHGDIVKLRNFIKSFIHMGDNK